jgi:hypothetical protein
MSLIEIRGVIQQGRLEVEEPVNLPDGTQVSLAISESAASEINSDQAWDNSPEGVADWLKWYEKLEPLVMTAREEAEAEAWLRQVNARGAAELTQCTVD